MDEAREAGMTRGGGVAAVEDRGPNAGPDSGPDSGPEPGGGLVLSANLGFLFTDLPFPDRIRAAADAGFSAVEFHDQAQADLAATCAAVQASGMAVMALNTRMGATMGAAALDQAMFRADFAAALAAAQAVGARAIHVTAGRATGAAARACYLDNLGWALACTDRPLLLEPICAAAVPGYHLAGLDDFDAVAAALDHPQLRLLADWYHLGTALGPGAALARMQGTGRLGHIQIARLPDRGDPTPEALPEWPALRALAAARGVAVGLEYRPDQPVARLRDQLVNS